MQSNQHLLEDTTLDKPNDNNACNSDILHIVFHSFPNKELQTYVVSLIEF